MAATDSRIDAYIARQAEFARPILEHLRRLVHAAAPEAEETIKWSMPHFTVGGRILGAMGGFKAHAAFVLPNDAVGETGSRREAMGQFGRLTSVADLPAEEDLKAAIRRAADLVASGAKARLKQAPKPPLETPVDFAAALDAVPAAAAAFADFPPGGRREYVEWVVDAKRPETRAKRIAQAVEWIAQGKRRNWKYENC
jgi:uncharacterized protein YdeI (YjbR/CyaY-like superfamily)